MSFVDELKAELEKTGFGGVEPSLDGEYQRWGDKKSFWLWSLEEGGVVRAVWADHRDGVRHEWCSKGKLSADEREGFEEKLKELDAEKRAEWERVAGEAQAAWDAPILDPLASSLYFQRKGLGENYGCRVHNRGAERSTTWVPLRDIDGKMWSLQWIDQGGGKGFMSGGRVAGCFHTIGQRLEETRTVYVCEGVATGASIYEAMHVMGEGCAVVCAMNAGNMTSVCCAVRDKYNVEIVVCGDSDDVGLSKGEDAAAACGGVFVAPKGLLEGTDFNDLYAAASGEEEGRELVRHQIRRVIRAQQGELLQLVPIGKAKRVSEEQMAEALANHYGAEVLAQEGTLWRYNGQYWEECRDHQIKKFKRELMKLYGAGSTMRDIEGAYRNFLTRIDEVPKKVDFFTPNPFCANFKNGTLFVQQEPKTRGYSMKFVSGHRATDYLTTVLDYNFDWDWSETNSELLQMLDNMFEGDPDKGEKIRAIKQMYGACLIPAFPHLFFVFGGAGTGKSTLIHLAKLLVDENNTCKVEPHAMNGFNMETMVGKLVNYCTDVTIDKPLSDAALKRIIDRDKERIRRKGIKDIQAPLPPVHIWGGNKIPNTTDGASGAHDRRWTFIGCHKSQLGANGGKPDLNFWSMVRDSAPRGLLNFALEGLKDLCDNDGQFTMPASGREEMVEWTGAADPLKRFLDEVREGVELVDGNIKVCGAAKDKIGQDGFIKGADFHQVYRQWIHEEDEFLHALGRYDFYRDLKRHHIYRVRQDKTGPWGFYVGCVIRGELAKF